MKCIVIGLGNYGQVLAEELSALGHEVVGVDRDASRVEGIKDRLAAALVMDVTDEQSFSVLPLSTVDLVIVAIGESFGASVRAVAMLKRAKVKHLYARAMDPIHHSVMEAFQPERILNPEEEAAKAMAHILQYGAEVETFQVDQDYSVVKFTVPSRLVGYYVNELNLHKNFGLKLIALKRAHKLVNSLGIEFTEHDVVNELPENEQVQEGDQLVCYGRMSDLRKFWKAL